MDQFLGIRQTLDEIKRSPHRLRMCLIESSPLVSPSNKWKIGHSGSFEDIPQDIILLIANGLNCFDISVLERVCRRFFVIIRLKWPLNQRRFALWSYTGTEKPQKWNIYEFYIKLHKRGRWATYNSMDDPNNSKVDPVHSLVTIMDRFIPSDCEVDPSQWEVCELKSEKNSYSFNELWAHYLEKCRKLVCVGLINASGIHLNLENHTNLEGFFMELKSADGKGASITLPNSMKAIVLYATEENYRRHDSWFSNPCVNSLYLSASGCTKLELL
jgi:hypothetical protein